MIKPARVHGLSPTAALLFGLVITLTTVIAYSWYITGQISGLRRLQADLTDRNRMASLQLLRIQSDLNQLSLAMREMLAASPGDSVTEWAPQFDRIRADLDDALRREEQVSVVARTPAQTKDLADSVAQFWTAADRVFALARAGEQEAARAEIRQSLLARQGELSTTVGRLLIQNNETEERAARQAQDIYARVQTQVYWFLTAALVAIAGTSLYLIQSNRRLFAQLGALAEERRVLARELIAARESTLREIARELHDEFGQLLTAMGTMLRRAERHAPEQSPLRSDMREIGEVAQAALDNVRGLSQTLHPSILDELGLESTIEWYLSTVRKQLGIDVEYERRGAAVPVPATTAIHVYRVLQEAVNNVARHSGATAARVRLHYEAGALVLEVEDDGKGLSAPEGGRGLGLIAMRERAELVDGSLDLSRPAAGGTCVRLRVPLKGA